MLTSRIPIGMFQVDSGQFGSLLGTIGTYTYTSMNTIKSLSMSVDKSMRMRMRLVMGTIIRMVTAIILAMWELVWVEKHTCEIPWDLHVPVVFLVRLQC